MADRYLFRAKRTDNGEWVEGYYVQTVVASYIVFPYKQNTILGEGETIEVDQSTICQCTGFSDDDGKRIFEGDIVDFIDCTSTESGYSEHYCRGKVVWDEETASFQVTERLSAENYEVLDRGCKVIGNIFDNPELLEVES